MRRMKIGTTLARNRAILFLMLASLASVTMCSTAHAVTKYSLVDLGVPSGVDFSEGIDVNDKGQVVARTWASGYFYGFLWDDGIQAVFDTGYQYNRPYGINEDGVVLGTTSSSASVKHAFVWEDGEETYLGHIPGGQVWTYPYAINDSGLVVGNSLGDPGNSRQFFTWQDGEFTNHGIISVGYDPLPPEDLSDSSSGMDVNELGQVVGYTQRRGSSIDVADICRVWIWQDGEVTTLPLFSEDPESYQWAAAINNNGEILGSCRDEANGTRQLIWDNGVTTFLEDMPGLRSPYAESFNDDGLVVGSAISPNNEMRALFWDNQHRVYDLNALLDDSGTGWVLERARAINNNGWIVGGGINPDGKGRGFLLIPIPEPSIATLLIMGAMALLASSARNGKRG